MIHECSQIKRIEELTEQAEQFQKVSIINGGGARIEMDRGDFEQRLYDKTKDITLNDLAKKGFDLSGKVLLVLNIAQTVILLFALLRK